MAIRKTLEEVKEILLSRGFLFISGEYKNYLSKIEVRCTCGNVYISNLRNICDGYKCKKCGVERSAKSRIQTIEELRESKERLPYVC